MLIFSSVILAMLVLGVIWVLIERWRWSLVTSKRVWVHIGETSVSGVVISKRGPLLSLADAAIFANGQPQPIDGRLVIERCKIDWIQEIS